MSVSDAHNRASIKYNRKMDSITIRPTKEEGERIRSAAEKEKKSIKEFITDAIQYYIDHNKTEE